MLLLHQNSGVPTSKLSFELEMHEPKDVGRVQSTRSLDGQCRTLPCEPPPLAQCGASGLNRAQQLLAAQALLVPAIPSYDASDGGVVSSLQALGTM